MFSAKLWSVIGEAMRKIYVLAVLVAGVLTFISFGPALAQNQSESSAEHPLVVAAVAPVFPPIPGRLVPRAKL